MKKKPIRMCIVCRDRISKDDLLRLQYKNQEIINYAYEARSFYLCLKCIDNPSQLFNRAKKMFKNNTIKLNFTTN